MLVVANGCTDDTADVAASYGPGVQVLSVPVASKHAALSAAYDIAADFPRIYVDADVELRASDVRALAAALRRPGVFAAAPERTLATTGSSWPVRWFYDVWARLPEVRSGLWGRGVIAVDSRGQKRLAALPPLLGDDLAASLSFAPHERAIVPDARVVVHIPRTVTDLLRRRIRTVDRGWPRSSGPTTRPSQPREPACPTWPRSSGTSRAWRRGWRSSCLWRLLARLKGAPRGGARRLFDLAAR